VYAQVHFEPGKSLFLNSQFHHFSKFYRIVCTGSIGIHPDFITISSSQQLPCRYIVGFSCQIPESHFNCANPSALTAMVSELPYDLEDHFNITGIKSQYPAFQEKSIPYIGAVPYFAQSVNTLVGIDPYNMLIHYSCITHISYFKIRRAGCPADLLGGLGNCIL